jgi:hypothetical protein
MYSSRRNGVWVSSAHVYRLCGLLGVSARAFILADELRALEDWDAMEKLLQEHGSISILSHRARHSLT